MINFEQVEKKVRQLNHGYAEGEINERELESQLLDLVDLAADGQYWMYGHRSERWFRHDGQGWVADHPDPVLVARTKAGVNSQHASSAAQPEAPDLNSIIFNLFVIFVIGWIVYMSAA